MPGEMNQLNNNQVGTAATATGGMPVLGQTPAAPATPPTMSVSPSMPVGPAAPAVPGTAAPAAPVAGMSSAPAAPTAPMMPTAPPVAPAMPTAPMAATTPATPTMPTGQVSAAGASMPGAMPNLASPGMIPSVAPTAPGAQPKPVQPVTAALEPQKMAADDKRSSVMMIVLVGILVILIAVAVGLWWMNVQGISLFSAKSKPATSTQEVTAALPTPVPEVIESSAEADEDVCTSGINAEGKRAIVEDFTSWSSQYFTPIEDTDETYKGLFLYYMDRSAFASGHCDDYNIYCETDFAQAMTFAAQFAHYDEQRSREPVSDYTTRVAAAKLRDNMALNFNLNNVDLSSVVLDVNSQSQRGLDYNAADDTVAAFGPHGEPSSDYTFEFEQVLVNSVENTLVLRGRAVAGPTCRRANGCECLNAEIDLLMGYAPTGDPYYMHEYVTPETE